MSGWLLSLSGSRRHRTGAVRCRRGGGVQTITLTRTDQTGAVRGRSGCSALCISRRRVLPSRWSLVRCAERRGAGAVNWVRTAEWQGTERFSSPGDRTPCSHLSWLRSGRCLVFAPLWVDAQGRVFSRALPRRRTGVCPSRCRPCRLIRAVRSRFVTGVLRLERRYSFRTTASSPTDRLSWNARTVVSTRILLECQISLG